MKMVGLMIFSITYYAPVIFVSHTPLRPLAQNMGSLLTIDQEQSVGLSRDISLLLSGFNGIAYFLSSLIPIWILDRIGRVSLVPDRR